jgi:hypothetical protein
MKNKKILRITLLVAIVIAISTVVTLVNPGNAKNMTFYDVGYATGAIARHSFMILIIMYWISTAIHKIRQNRIGMIR